MNLSVKDMDLATGGVLVAILNENDAQTLDLFPNDRILIKKGSKETVAVVNISESEKSSIKGNSIVSDRLTLFLDF